MTISFNTIPSNTLVPLFYAEMDNQAANTAQDSGASLLIGHANIRECLQWMIDDGVVSRIDLDIRRTGINELGNSITLWRRDGPVMISFDDLWSAITHGGQ